MSANQKLAISPHIHSGHSTSHIMLDVLIALLPVTVAGAVIFGWQSLLVVGACVATSVLSELLFTLITKKPTTIGDLSAAVTGLILGLNLPANTPLWQCVVGSVFAIVIVKGLFGGLGQNVVNPAVTARVFMLLSFPAVRVVTSLPAEYTANLPGVADTVSKATPLAQGAAEMPSLLDMAMGIHGGVIGETCSIALLLGGAYLLLRRVITWQIPVFYIGTVFAFSFFMEGMNAESALKMVLAGGLLLGAFFMATDYVTSPPTPWGKVLFGLGCGLLTCLIRYFAGNAGHPVEGVSYAILLMNILNPFICKMTQRKVFGVGGKNK